MTRHSRNSTNSSVYSYAERQKDMRQSGYGTLNERLSGDSVKPFDCCSLSLQVCKDPMIDLDGFIFDKEAILSYIVEQKKEQKRLTKAYEQYIQLEEQKKTMTANAELDEKKRKFCSLETTPAHIFMDGYQKPTSSKRQLAIYEGTNEPASKKGREYEEGSVSNMAGDKANQYKSFWVPELVTTAEADKIEKPTGKILNPMSGKSLKFKDLMPVVFTPVNAEEAKSSRIHSAEERYKCPISGDVLTNSARAAYIKPSQRVVSWRCVENIIKKDMIDPITNAKLDESDIIELQRGGTGFSSSNKLEAALVRPQMSLS